MPGNNLTSNVSARGSSASQSQSRQTPKSRSRSRHTAPSSPLPPPPKLQVPEPPLKYEKMEAKEVNLEQPSLERVNVEKLRPLQAEEVTDEPPPLSPISASSRKPIWRVVKPASLTQGSERVEGAKSALEKGAQNSHRVDVKKSGPLQATPVKEATGGNPSISPHLPPGRRKPVPPSSPLPPLPDRIVEDIIDNDGKNCLLSQLNHVKILTGIAKRNDLKSKTVKLSIAALKKILQEHDNIENPFNVITNLGFCIKNSTSVQPSNAASAKFNGKEEEVKNWLAAIILLDKNYEEIAKSKSLKAYFKTTKKALKARLRLFRKKK